MPHRPLLHGGASVTVSRRGAPSAPPTPSSWRGVCYSEQAGRPKCPIDPFFIVPDRCRCVDFQLLKLQEAPEAVPNGEMPRHLQMYCDRYLCEKVVPGNRVTVVGIYSIRKAARPTKVSTGVNNTEANARFAILADFAILLLLFQLDLLKNNQGEK